MADEIRLIHTGDTHLGYRQYHSEVRRQDFMDAFATVITDAIKMQVDAVVHAGDLFDSRNPTLDDILETMQLFSRLKEADIPLLAIVGNHESKQNTQWLDLYENMGLVTRLAAVPYILKGVAIYGIDSVSKSKIPLFDYSIFDDKGTDAHRNILVMHQLMKPFAFGEWDVKEVIDSLPFAVDAILLGDNHKHEIVKVDDTWVTYCGSTERNSSSEREPRSYNIITVNDADLDISKRIIPTREYLFIPVHISKDTDGYEEVFSAIKEHKVEDKVVFVNISGDPQVKVKLSEVEDFLLSRSALVPVIKDIRMGDESLLDPSMKISFADPDDVVKEEIKKLRFTSAGMMLDEIIRDSQIPKTRVDEETEHRIVSLLDDMDFSQDLPDVLMISDAEGHNTNLLSAESEVSEPDADLESDTEADTGVDAEADTELDSGEDADSEVNAEKTLDETEHVERSDSGEPTVKPRQYNLGDYI
ncbi:exonuclease SbcCD subunit D [Methanolobus sp. ZRKC3]|uniref:metallophosphoesterase n=1 Tax=Methanolobus sp. ZRKC3 TaxID=3125786 RepID=UPI003247C31A